MLGRSFLLNSCFCGFWTNSEPFAAVGPWRFRSVPVCLGRFRSVQVGPCRPRSVQVGGAVSDYTAFRDRNVGSELERVSVTSLTDSGLVPAPTKCRRGGCPYIIQVFFHDSWSHSLHGSGAGHASRCKRGGSAAKGPAHFSHYCPPSTDSVQVGAPPATGEIKVKVKQ